MRNSKSIEAPEVTKARAQILESLQHHTLAEVARALGMDRSSVSGFVLGACRQGTKADAVARVHLLPRRLAKAS